MTLDAASYKRQERRGLSERQSGDVRSRLRRKMSRDQSEGGYAFPMTALLVTARRT